MALRDGGGGLLAIALAPALGEPFGRVEEGIDGFREDGLALAGEAAQQRVAERDIARGAGILVQMADGEVDGGMVGHVEEEDLRRGGDHDRLEGAGIARAAALEPGIDRLLDRAEAPEGGDRDGARQRGVGRIEPEGGR